MQKKIEEQIQILQKNTSEREGSFIKELENLRSQVKELTSTCLALTVNIKAEDKDIKDL